MSGKHLEIVVCVEHRYGHPDGYGTDQAVDQFPDRLAAAPASTVENCGLLIIGGLGREQRPTCQKSAKVAKVLLVASSRKQLHTDGVTGSYFAIEESIDTDTNRATGVA